ncbi:diiron oxygenase [Myxococcota bacterium]|nr:diiron oxygenase [Myxococcota bacterium]
MKASVDLVPKLSSISRKTLTDPIAEFDWVDTIDKGAHWFMSPELVSLYGTKTWDTLTEEQKKRLSFHEMVNAFSLALAGERLLVQRMAKYLYAPDYIQSSEYLHHFMEEENRHMMCFGRFALKYNGKVYASRHYALPSQTVEGEEEFQFWVSVLIFEEIGTFLNDVIGNDERVHPLSRQINKYHHREESRHLAYGRLRTPEVWAKYQEKWAPEVKDRLKKYVSNFLVAEFRDYFNPAAYADAQIPNRYEARTEALESPHSKEKFRKATASVMAVLTEAGIIEALPELA